MNNTNGNFTFTCPHCGQHLEAEPDMAGMKMKCPTCGKAIAIPMSQVNPAIEEPEIQTLASGSAWGLPKPQISCSRAESEDSPKGWGKATNWGIAIAIASMCLIAVYILIHRKVGASTKLNMIVNSQIEESRDNDIINISAKDEPAIDDNMSKQEFHKTTDQQNAHHYNESSVSDVEDMDEFERTTLEQMNRCIEIALAANISKEEAVQYALDMAEAVANGLKSSIGSKSRLVPQLGMGLAEVFLEAAAQTNDPKERKTIMTAGLKIATDITGTEGFRASVMFEFAKEYGLVTGSVQEKIQNHMDAGFVAEFAHAKRMIFQLAGNGSESVGKNIFDSPQAIGDLMNRLGDDGQKNVKDYLVTTFVKEIRSQAAKQRRKSEQQKATQVLYDMGVSRHEIGRMCHESDALTINRTLKNMLPYAESDDDKKRIQTAQGRWGEIFKAKMKANGDKDEATAAANDAWLSEMRKNGVLTGQQLEDILQAISDSRVVKFKNAAIFRNGDIPIDDSICFRKPISREFLKTIGAVGTSGKLAGTVFVEVCAGMYDVLTKGGCTDLQDGEISASDMREEYEDITNRIHSGDFVKQRQAVAIFSHRIYSLSEGSRETVRRYLQQKISTDQSCERRKQEPLFVADLLAVIEERGIK